MKESKPFSISISKSRLDVYILLFSFCIIYIIVVNYYDIMIIINNKKRIKKGFNNS